MNTNTNDTTQPASATRPDCAPSAGSAPLSHRRIQAALAKKGYTADRIEYERPHGMIEMAGPDGGWRVTGIRPITRGQDGFLLALTLTVMLSEIETLPNNQVRHARAEDSAAPSVRATPDHL